MKLDKKNNLKQVLNCLLVIAVSFAVSGVQAQNTNQPLPNSSGENVILQWNRVLTETIRTPGAHPSAQIFPVRSYAMMHAAMFDAVNSIERAYTPYLTEVPAAKKSSSEAAAAQAARDVLAALYPARQTIFDAELAVSLKGIETNRVKQGSKVGIKVAEQILAKRADDGWNNAPPPFGLPAMPGNFQMTPPTAAAFTHYPAVQPFALISGAQFLPNPPPALTSAEYARDLNEVKEFGSAMSATRTADQTLTARLWASVNTPTTIALVWNNVARRLAVSRNLKTSENARFFALCSIAVHDALQTSFTAKYRYGLWRPEAAIHRAGEDGNPDTVPDAAWKPLIPTPPYPAYTGNQAAYSMTQATILALFFGRDDIAFEHTWEGTGGATRSYSSFSAMANENADSRLYAGIHFRFDNAAGQSIGRNVANYVFSNFMRPRRCDCKN